MADPFDSTHQEVIEMGKKQFRVIHRYPRYSEEERERAKAEIEQKLFDIFRKYQHQS